MKAPLITVVVLNFNGGEDVVRCVESIRKSEAPGYRVRGMVVDNGSTDGSLAEVTERFPDTEVVRNGENLGYCEGNNVGMRRALAAGSALILLLNDDALLAPDALGAMAARLEKDPGIGIVGPRIRLDDDPDRLWAAGGRSGFRPNVLALIGHGARDSGQFDEAREVEFVPGCALLVRAEVCRKIGLLDPVFFAYFEDADYCFRARGEGFRTWYEPDAVVRHRVSASTGGGKSPARKYLMGLNSVVFLQRHGTAGMWIAFVLCDVLAFPLALLVSALRGEGRALLAKGRGLVHGIRGIRADAAAVMRFSAARSQPVPEERSDG